MGRNITPEMLKAIELVESGQNRYRAAITAGVRPSSLYARLARHRRRKEAALPAGKDKKDNGQQQQAND